MGEAAQFGADREAVELGHHHVEQDEVGLFGERAREAALAVRRRQRAVAFAASKSASAVRMGVSSSMIKMRSILEIRR